THGRGGSPRRRSALDTTTPTKDCLRRGRQRNADTRSRDRSRRRRSGDHGLLRRHRGRQYVPVLSPAGPAGRLCSRHSESPPPRRLFDPDRHESAIPAFPQPAARRVQRTVEERILSAEPRGVHGAVLARRLQDPRAPELLLVPPLGGSGTGRAAPRAGAGPRCVRAVVRHALPGRRAEAVLRSRMGNLRLLESNEKTALSRLLHTLGVVFTTQSLAQALASEERRLDLGDTMILS